MSDKRFRVSSNKRTAAFFALLGGFIGSLIIESKVTDIDANLIPCLVIAILIGVVASILCAVLVKEFYLQIFEDGFELVKGNKITKYPFSAFEGSNVTRNYMNGIYTGTTREIKITDETGKSLNINANNLSKGAFAELVTYLGQTRYTESLNMEEAAGYFNEGSEFRIPNDNIINANKKKMVTQVAITIALLVIFLGLLIYYLVTRSDSAMLLTIMIFAGGGAVVNLFMEVIPAVLLYNKVKNLPNRIYADRNSLVIGNRTFNEDTVLNILMVPASYDILTRDMIIITKNNEKLMFNFGKKDLKGELTYSDYDKLCGTIELWCIVNKVNFVRILG